MNKCLFCKIIKGDIPSAKVYENETVFAFKDVNPQAPVHILLIPKKHIDTVIALKKEDSALIAEMVFAANEIAKQESIADDGFRLLFNCGKSAGQEVFHLHMHILGGRNFSWPPG